MDFQMAAVAAEPSLSQNKTARIAEENGGHAGRCPGLLAKPVRVTNH